jgi:hypothetical protein
MNVYSCIGKNIFYRWKMECSIQIGCRLVEWNLIKIFLPLHSHANIHYLYNKRHVEQYVD